jgi:hypothetical protein
MKHTMPINMLRLLQFPFPHVYQVTVGSLFLFAFSYVWIFIVVVHVVFINHYTLILQVSYQAPHENVSAAGFLNCIVMARRTDISTVQATVIAQEL